MRIEDSESGIAEPGECRYSRVQQPLALVVFDLRNARLVSRRCYPARTLIADERSVEVRLRHQLSRTCLDALGLLRA